jgi:hypothetical protein
MLKSYISVLPKELERCDDPVSDCNRIELFDDPNPLENTQNRDTLGKI